MLSQSCLQGNGGLTFADHHILFYSHFIQHPNFFELGLKGLLIPTQKKIIISVEEIIYYDFNVSVQFTFIARKKEKKYFNNP